MHGENFMTLLYENENGLSYGFDTTGNNEIDTYISLNDPAGETGYVVLTDTTGDGFFDSYQGYQDFDEDGFAESFFLANDYDDDGTIDYAKLFVDKNADGDFEEVISLHADNTDPLVDYRIEVDVDLNGDHQTDYHFEDIIPANSEISEFVFHGGYIGSADSSGCFDPMTPSEYVSGTPASDMEVWECQGQTNRCTLYSQMFVVEQITGKDINVEDFVNTATNNGWFSEEGGATALNMDKMLTYYNIDHDMIFDANMEQLETELINGNKLIVSVDSGQIWYGESNDIFSPATQADHALQVIGIDHSDPDNPMVVLNDSGTSSGCGEMVPWETFENAWAAGDHQMIVCRA